MPSRSSTAHRIHGDLDCVATESLLAESSGEVGRLNERVADLESALARCQAALLREQSKRRNNREVAAEVKDALAEQIGLMTDEIVDLDALVPAPDAFAVGTLTNAEVRDLYRQSSRVTRGPLPAYISAALTTHAEEISTAMEQAAHAETQRIIRNAIRRQRRR
jgi:uncharacterized small protein (DUF1192 family)